MNNVAIYLRKSREDEELKGETLQRHETMLLDYCKRNNLIVERIYHEIVSGENIENRPEMVKLLHDVSSGMYNGIVCVDLERLSRGNPIDQCEILETFKASNTKIYTLNKVYDLSKQEIDEEYFEFALFMSRREYKMIKSRLIRGRLQATKDGYYTGSILPYGYTKEKADRGYILIPHPQESKIVKLIFNKYLNGENLRSIAKYLNSNGIKTKKGKQWNDYNVSYVLQNKNHIGMIKSKKYGEWIDGKHTGIIDHEIFEMAQNMKEVKENRCKASKQIKNPLATIAVCGCCGYTMLRKVNGSKVQYLSCDRIGCENKAVKLELAESALIEELKKELKDFNYFLENYSDEMKIKQVERENEIEVLKKELIRKREMLTRACEMLEEGIYTIELFKSRTSALECDMKHIEDRIEELNSIEIDTGEKARTAIPILKKVLEIYDTLEPHEKNKILKSIVKSVEITRTKDELKLDVELLV